MENGAIAFVAAGLVVGFASGVLGIGGAIVLIPILVFVFHFTQAEAQGTSIGALVPPVGLFAALHYYRAGLLDVRAAALVALGFVFGAFGGAAMVPHLPQVWLRRAFAALLAYVAAQMAFGHPERRVAAAWPGAVAVAAMGLLQAMRRAFEQKASHAGPYDRPPADYSI